MHVSGLTQDGKERVEQSARVALGFTQCDASLLHASHVTPSFHLQLGKLPSGTPVICIHSTDAKRMQSRHMTHFFTTSPVDPRLSLIIVYDD